MAVLFPEAQIKMSRRSESERPQFLFLGDFTLFPRLLNSVATVSADITKRYINKGYYGLGGNKGSSAVDTVGLAPGTIEYIAIMAADNSTLHQPYYIQGITFTDNELGKYTPNSDSAYYPHTSYLMDVLNLGFTSTSKPIAGALAKFLCTSPLYSINNGFIWRYFDLNQGKYMEYKLPALIWKAMVVPFKEPSLISADTVAVIRELNSLLTALQLTLDETLWFTKAYDKYEGSTQNMLVTRKADTKISIASPNIDSDKGALELPGVAVYSLALSYTICLLGYLYYVMITAAKLQVQAANDQEEFQDNPESTVYKNYTFVIGMASALLTMAKNAYGELLNVIKFLAVPSPLSLPEFRKCHRFSMLEQDMAAIIAANADINLSSLVAALSQLDTEGGSLNDNNEPSEAGEN